MLITMPISASRGALSGMLARLRAQRSTERDVAPSCVSMPCVASVAAAHQQGVLSAPPRSGAWAIHGPHVVGRSRRTVQHRPDWPHGAGVGKTCLVLRYVEGKFFDQKSSTIGASFMVKKL